VPTDAHVERMVADVRFFLSNLTGASPLTPDRAVRPFPSQEVDHLPRSEAAP
jgi:hypothetical protein